MARQLLDQYYTKPAIAQECWSLVRGLLWQIGWNRDDICVLEPSAGRGAFLDAVGDIPKMGVEVDPAAPPRPEIVFADFMSRSKWDKPFQEMRRGRMPVVMGNPPFGRKGDVALDFLNECLDVAGVIGFVLPLGFRKWSSQSRVQRTAHLVIDHDLPVSAFFAGDKDFALRCCFQVWTRADIGVPLGYYDLRLTAKPRVDHEDFSAWQYNRTVEAEKYFDYDWDFAVLRQGYGDYTRRYFDRKDLDRKQQWIFFKAHSEPARQRLLALDFDALSKRNIGLPGFGKADVVQAYEASSAARPARPKKTATAKPSLAAAPAKTAKTHKSIVGPPTRPAKSAPKSPKSKPAAPKSRSPKTRAPRKAR
jgi:hypothetical protein